MKRRTESDRIEIIQLKQEVIELINKHKISAYEIGEKVSNVTFPTVLKIADGTTQFPNKAKLQSIKEYIELTYENKKVDKVAEVKAEYFEEVSLKTIFTAIKKLDKKIDKGIADILDHIEEADVRQQLIFEFLTNAKATEVKFLQEQIAEKFGK